MTKDEFAKPDTSNQLSMDDKAEIWAEYLMLRDMAAKYKKWHARMKEIFGEYDEITIGGNLIATHTVGGAVNQAQLRADHPEIYAAYQDPQTVLVFNTELFEQQRPDLADAYRSRSLRIKN
jgi:hypothetical protein